MAGYARASSPRPLPQAAGGRTGLESFELCGGIVVDLDADEHVAGIEIEWASQQLDIERLRHRLIAAAGAHPYTRFAGSGAQRLIG